MATPTVWTEAPARVPRTNTLLDLIDVAAFPGGRSMPVEFIGDNCEWPAQTPQDCYIGLGDAAGSAKNDGGAGDLATGQTFGVYAGVDCFINGGVDEMRAMARERLEAGQSYVVEGVILGALSPTSAGSGASIIDAVAALEDSIAPVNARGIIWMSPSAATKAVAEGLLIRDPLTGNLSTYLGTSVVVAAVLANADTVYATGPVHLWGGSVVESDGYALTSNTVKVLAERMFSFTVECDSWSYTLTEGV